MSAVTYGFSEAQFHALAEGVADEETAAILSAGQLSKRRQLLVAVTRAARGGRLWRDSGADEALRVLAAADAADADATEVVLRHPHLDAWAATCLRGLRGNVDGAHGSLSDVVGYLNAVAAAAAVRAGIPFRLRVPTFAGHAVLPTLGAVPVDGARHVVVDSEPGRLTVSYGGVTATVDPDSAGAGGAWLPRRDVALDAGPTLSVDDLDHYRDAYQWPPAPRLPDEQFARFRSLLTDAWRIIQDRHRPYAAPIRAALRCVVPLADPAAGGSISGASRRTFGAVGVSVPDSAAELALLLIHESQHMVLDGLLDLVDLYEHSGVARYRAPWRMDPRPVGALLQGTYAHLAVARFWQVERRVATGAELRRATVEFDYWRQQNRLAIAELAGADELTDAGRTFVGRLAGAVEALLAEPVPRDIAAGVAAMTAAQTVRWRLRNWDPGSSEPLRAAKAWRRREPLAGPIAAPVVRTAAGPLPSGAPGLAGLIRRALVSGASATLAAPDVTPADRAYLAGDLPGALRRYGRAIVENPAAEDAWVGLALSLPRDAEPPTAKSAGSVAYPTQDIVGFPTLVMARPDLVRMAYLSLQAPDEMF
jgi:uncharacterized protein